MWDWDNCVHIFYCEKVEYSIGGGVTCVNSPLNIKEDATLH